jgi:trehalose 6-phosphate synthase
MWDTSRSPNIDRVVYDAWEKGYVPVNEAFARAVIEEAGRSERPPIVLLNDYHLYLASSYIRQALPEQIIQYFIHIPWPSSSCLQLIPAVMREALLRSLCTSDIVGLQTMRDVHSFLSSCDYFLKEAEIDYGGQNVHLGGHTVRVRAYPISIDVPGLNRLLDSERLREYVTKLKPLCGEQTIVRVDRMEPTKNIIRGFRSFDMFLERYPEFRGRVNFICFLVPSRAHLRVYQRYNEDVKHQIELINGKYGTEDWQPISYFYENNYTQALAGMSLSDVLLVNAVADGMNLVAKEGPTVNSRDGVLVLSEGVGACEQLGEYALVVSPADLEGTVQALYQALTISPEEKRRRAREMKRAIAEEDLTDWVIKLMEGVVNLFEK